MEDISRWYSNDVLLLFLILLTLLLLILALAARFRVEFNHKFIWALSLGVPLAVFTYKGFLPSFIENIYWITNLTFASAIVFYMKAWASQKILRLK